MPGKLIDASVASAAGAATTIAVWALSRFAHVDLPGDVAAALTTLLVAGAGLLTHHARDRRGLAFRRADK